MRLCLLLLVPVALLMLSLSGCGQTGRLFLRMPPVTLPPVDPPPHIKVRDILPPPATTAPAAATAHVVAAATRSAAPP